MSQSQRKFTHTQRAHARWHHTIGDPQHGGGIIIIIKTQHLQ